MRNWSKALSAGVLASGLTGLIAGPALAAPATLTVSDQKAVDDTITIADVNLPKNGFLVIHPSDAKGNLIEKDIGHLALTAGDHKAVKVKLTGAIKAGDKLWAMLHEDTGTAGQYEFGMAGKNNVDMPLKENGKVVENAFKLQ
ncbi:MAG: hypothetical protein ACKVP7_07550 [Hyphomicrobiaceae bacterium]